MENSSQDKESKLIGVIFIELANLMILYAFLHMLVHCSTSGEFIGSCIGLAVLFIGISAIRIFTPTCLSVYIIIGFFATIALAGDAFSATILCYFEVYFFFAQICLYAVVRLIRFPGSFKRQFTAPNGTEAQFRCEDFYISNADENMMSRKIDSCLDAIAEREAEILADLFCRDLKNDVTNTLFKQIQGAFDGIGTGRIVFQRDNVQVNKQTVRDSGEIKLYCREYVYGASVEGGGEMRVSIMLHHIWERHNEFVGIGSIVINRADGGEFVIGRRGYPYEDC